MMAGLKPSLSTTKQIHIRGQKGKDKQFDAYWRWRSGGTGVYKRPVFMAQ